MNDTEQNRALREALEGIVLNASENPDFAGCGYEKGGQTCQKGMIRFRGGWVRCPKCNFDSVEQFGFRDKRTGDLIDASNLESLVNNPKLCRVSVNSVCWWGSSRPGKTIWLKYAFNVHLFKLKYREFIYIAREPQELMRLEDGEFKSVLREIKKAKVVIYDEFADPETYSFQENKNGAQWAARRSAEKKEIFDLIHDAEKTLITAGQHNPFETIKNAGIIGRMTELYDGNVFEV